LSTFERALLDAQGKALMMLAAVLEGRGLMESVEFGNILGAFAVVVDEDSSLEGASSLTGRE